MSLLYPAFERARMIRKGEQIVAPIISMSKDMELPINSAFHYIGESKIDTGPGSDHPLFKSTLKPVQVYTPLKLIDPINKPHEITFDSNAIIRGFFMRNRRMRRVTALDKVPKDEKSIFVINYSLIHNSYKYIRSLYAEYNEWVDTMLTVTSTMNILAQNSQRNQFLMLGVPTVLPSISRLRAACENMDQASLKIFHTPDARMLLELWKWLDVEHYPSIFDRIDEKNYRFINFIIQDSNQWIAVNLSKLHLWKQETRDAYQAKIKEDKANKKKGLEVEPDEGGAKPVGVTFNEAQLQKYVLRLFMVMAAARSDSGIDADAAVKKALQGKPVDVKQKVVDGKVVESADDDLGEDENGNPIKPKDEDDVEEISVKKGKDLADSVVSSKNLNDVEVKSSEELLRDAMRVNAHEDDDLSKIKLNDDVNALIDADLAELENLNTSEIAREVLNPTTGEILPLAVDDTRPYESKIRDRCNVLADAGLITAAEYRRLTTLAEKYKTLPNPRGGKGTLIEAMHVPPEELAVNTKHIVAPSSVVVDESMRYSSIEASQQKYIKETLPKHILKMITHIQSNDIILDNLEIEKNEDILGANESYSVRIVPIEGVPGTLRFPIPVIDEDGTYTANNVKYSMRNQRGDYPIRKISPVKVVLTSYYGKFSVVRSRKSTNDYSQWIINEVMSMGFDPDITHIYDVHTADVFQMEKLAPRSISSLAKQIREFTVRASDGESFVFHLDLSKIKENFNMAIVQPWIDKGFTPIAVSDKKHIVYYEGEEFYMIHGENVKPLGDLEEILGLNAAEGIPAEYCELKIAGKYVPVGMILAYDYGLTELVRRLKITTRRVPVGTRTQQQPDEVALVFSDETLLFSKNDRLATLLLGGFLEFKRVIRSFSITDFDNRGVYQNVFDSTGGGTRVLRELKMARDLFVDPITKEVLVQLNQPTDFMGILVYSTELLLDDRHRPEFDMSEQRIRGYERVAGAVYQEMIRSLRAHNSRPGKSRYPVEMKPYAIWTSLAQDTSVVVVKDINPLANLKQREEVTYTGNGGRSKDTMTASSREYGKNDIGIISEATKDSGEVGINTYMPPNPQLTNTLGMPVAPENKELGMSSIFSSSVLASPAATHDDMKRVGFISIQHDHGVGVVGQMENILRSDYESIIPHRTTEMFAVSAKQKGIVKEMSEHGMTVQYEDGTSKSYPLGRMYGENAGMTIPHELITNLKVNTKFNAGDALTFNKAFFKPDTLNPKQVVWCNGTYANFALCEPTDVLEDASVICQELADMLVTNQTKHRTILAKFSQSISKLVKPGMQLKYDDILCIIQDEISSGMDIYDEADIDTLKALGSMAPKAKYNGIVERIEIFYRGDKEDMPDALRKIVTASDREIAMRRKAVGKKIVDGSVGEGFKVKGNSIPLDSVAIKIYLTGPEPAGVGDKIVLVNQLKSIIGKVTKEPMQSKDGKKVLGRFSYTSLARRIVNSPEIVGTTTAILLRGTELVLEAYDS